MKYKRVGLHKIAWLLFIFAVGSAPAMGMDAATSEADDGTTIKDMVLRGDAKCTRCHDESEEYPVLAIGKTKHGVLADSRTPTCTSCHGNSETHINKPAGVKERPKPDRTFGKKSQTSAADKNQACLTCHQGGARMNWAGSQHASGEVACTTCHQVHAQHDKVRVKATQPEVCYTCHKEQRAQANRASHHPINEGKVVCSNCHNPHGSIGPKLLHKATVNENCYTCHAEKRGPFLWEHPPASDNCTNCHTPHGSSHASLLKSRPPFLCTSCHIAGGHSTTGIRTGTDLGPLATPGATSTTAAPQMVGKACLNCHSKVHGSNHPSGARFVR